MWIIFFGSMDLNVITSLIIWFTWSLSDWFSCSNFDALANSVLCLSFLTRRNFLEAWLFLILFCEASSLQELSTEDGEPWDSSNNAASSLGRLIEWWNVPCSKFCTHGLSFWPCMSHLPVTGKLQLDGSTCSSSSRISTRPTLSSTFSCMLLVNSPFAAQDFSKTVPLQLSPDITFSSSATWSKNSSPSLVWSHPGSTDQKLEVWSWSGLSTWCSRSSGEARWASPIRHENISNQTWYFFKQVPREHF